MCRAMAGIMLGLVLTLMASLASAGVLYYDDGSTVSDNWSLTACDLTSDGEVLRELSSDAGYAILNLGFPSPVNELTVVFDFKVVNPGAFLGAYLSPPGEGLLIVNWWVAKSSRTQVGFLDNLKPDTWYSIAIYSKGSAGYQAFWIAEGKGVNLWNVSRAYEAGWSPWAGTSSLYFYAWANPTYPSAEWFFDDIRVNSGVDLTGGNPASVEIPTFSPNGGFFSGPQTVTISCATVGATIYYTTDGTTPSNSNSNGSFTTSGTVYISDNTTLQAIAYKTGYRQSAVASAVYAFPTSYNNPATIPYGMSALNGNVDAEWAGATWALLNQNYYGDNASADVVEAYYTARWTETKVYVAVKVRDTSHVLTGSYGGWNTQDDVELYLHTTGTGPTDYSASQADAQQYTVGVKPDNISNWSVLGAGMTVPSHAQFSAVGKASGQWLYYEAAITPFNHYDNTTGTGDIISPLSAGDIIGLDAVVGSRNGAAFSMLSENLWMNKSSNYNQLGIHLLGAKPTFTTATLTAVLAAMDSTPGGGTWNAAVDFDGDGEITSSDLAIVLTNLP